MEYGNVMMSGVKAGLKAVLSIVTGCLDAQTKEKGLLTILSPSAVKSKDCIQEHSCFSNVLCLLKKKNTTGTDRSFRFALTMQANSLYFNTVGPNMMIYQLLNNQITLKGKTHLSQ